MANDRISVELSDLTDYVGRNRSLSDDIGGAGNAHLDQHLSLSGTLFGDLGHETGLHNAVGEHIGRMHGHVHKLSGSVRDLGQAVHTARGDYEFNEEQHVQTYRKILD
jgi:hypothetical protein